MSGWPTRACGSARAPAAEILSQGRADHRRLQGDRGRGGASGLWLPVASATSFAKALDKAGIAFIGPPPKAIAAMGDKIESKKLAQDGRGQRRPRLSRRDRRLPTRR